MKKTELLDSIRSMLNRKKEFTKPTQWENDRTTVNSANLNKVSNSILDTQSEFSKESENIQSILTDMVESAAGCIPNKGSTAEIFNDYENNQAKKEYSHAEGKGTIANTEAQHVQGKYNVQDTSNKFAHIIGGGSSSSRKNIHTVDWSGNAEYTGSVTAKKDIVATDNKGNKISLLNTQTKISELETEIENTLTTDTCLIIDCGTSEINI